MRSLQYWIAVCLCALAVSQTQAQQAAQQAPNPPLAPPDAAGKVVVLQGSLTATQPGQKPRILAADGAINEGDVLATPAGSFARLKMVDGADVVLRPNTELAIARYRFTTMGSVRDGALLSLLRGSFRALTGLIGKRNPSAVAYNTRTATVGIRGTGVGIADCNNDCDDLAPPGESAPNGTHLEVTSGSATLTTEGGQTVVTKGQFAHAANRRASPQRVAFARSLRMTVPPSMRLEPAGGTTGASSTSNGEPSGDTPTSNETNTGTGTGTNQEAGQSGGQSTGSSGTAGTGQTNSDSSNNSFGFSGTGPFSGSRSSAVIGGGGRSVSPN